MAPGISLTTFSWPWGYLTEKQRDPPESSWGPGRSLRITSLPAERLEVGHVLSQLSSAMHIGIITVTSVPSMDAHLWYTLVEFSKFARISNCTSNMTDAVCSEAF